MSKKTYILQDFPIVIDPLVESLEVRLTEAEDGGRSGQTSWKQLGRVKVRHDSFPFTPSTSMVHYFGLGSSPAKCPFVLVYDSSGVIRYRLDQAGRNDFTIFPIPAELNGDVSVGPSVRVSFLDISQADSFARLVGLVRNGPGHPDNLSQLNRLLKKVTGLTISYAAASHANAGKPL